MKEGGREGGVAFYSVIVQSENIQGFGKWCVASVPRLVSWLLFSRHLLS